MEIKDYLINEFNQRKEANKSYSLRAFSRDLGLSPQHLHYVLNNRCGVSATVAVKIASKLNLSSFEKDKFILLARKNFERSKVARDIAQTSLAQHEEVPPTKELPLDLLKVTSKWYYIPILLLVESDKTNSIKDIADKLGISGSTVKSALAALVRSGLLKKIGRRYEKPSKHSAFTANHANEDLQRQYVNYLNIAKQTLKLDVELRHFSLLLTMMSVDDIPFVQKELNFFRKKIATAIDKKNSNPNQVFALSMQLFPVTKVGL